MKFPNAYDGISKVFTAQILALISTGCTILGGLTGGVGLVAGSVATGLGGGLLVLAALVLSVISLVINLIGLHKASLDEELFKPAFTLSIVNLVLSVLNTLISLFGASAVLRNIISLLVEIIGVFIIAYIFKGIASLAQKLNREDVAASGRAILILMYIAYGATIFCDLLELLFPTALGLLTFLGILAFLAGIATIVWYILYLIHLNKAKKMLAE